MKLRALAAVAATLGLLLASTVGSASVSAATQAPKEGTPVATMTAPRLGAKWSETIYEGASLKRVLTPLGLGHYSMTQMPGEIGNFAIAGHRVGSGGPFRNIDKFRKGDVVVVRTKKATFTYRYLQTKVVMPSEVEILLPDPAGLTAPRTSESLLTLQTCTPIHVNTKRLIVWFELVRQN